MNLSVKHTVDDINAELARRHLLDFIKYTWVKKEKYTVGLHTIEICKRIDKAIEDYKNGISSYFIITIPFRHGKSEIVSRNLPAYFLGKFPNSEVMLATYEASLSEGFSRHNRELIKTEKYRKIFNDIKISDKSSSVKHWELSGKEGELSAVGLGGTITGRGYHLGILDDYYKNREEAESITIRNKRWDSFTNDFFTRQAPVTITMIPCTRWHEDDIVGRIQNEAKKDPNFPEFEIISFPARSDQYKDEYLFLERYSRKWYLRQFAVLGNYASAAQLQCNPVAKGGNMLKVDKIVFHDSLEEFPKNIVYHRVWDLAHSKKERVKDDPDFTVGTNMGVNYIKNENGNEMPHIWIKDIDRQRENAPARDKKILTVTDRDGDTVKVAVESNTDSKDTYETFAAILTGKRTVIKIVSSKDKVIRATPLEPVFEAGHVHFLRANWNAVAIDELRSFPNCVHDDITDTIASGYNLLKNNAGIVTEDYSTTDENWRYEKRNSLI